MVRNTILALAVYFLPTVGSSQQTDPVGPDSFVGGWLIENTADEVFFAESGQITVDDLVYTEGLYIPSLPGVDDSTDYTYHFVTDSGRTLTVVFQSVGNSLVEGSVFVGIDGALVSAGVYPKDADFLLTFDLTPLNWSVLLDEQVIFEESIEESPLVFSFSRTLGSTEEIPDDVAGEVRIGLADLTTTGSLHIEEGTLNALEGVSEGIGELKLSVDGDLTSYNGIVGVLGGGKGPITVNALGDLYFEGGAGEGDDGFAQIGHGGPSDTSGTDTGAITVDVGGELEFLTGVPGSGSGRIGDGGNLGSIGHPGSSGLSGTISVQGSGGGGTPGSVTLSSGGPGNDPLAGQTIEVTEGSSAPGSGAFTTIRVTGSPSVDVLAGPSRSKMKDGGAFSNEKIKLEGREGKAVRSHSKIKNIGAGNGDFTVRASYSKRDVRASFKGVIGGKRKNLTGQIRSGRLVFANLAAGQFKMLSVTSRVRERPNSQSKSRKAKIKVSGSTSGRGVNRDRVTMILK